WRASALRLPGANVQPVLPARCRQIGRGDAVDEADRVTLRWTVDCGPGGLEGEVIGVDDLPLAKINALLTVERLDGEKLQTVLSPRSPSFTVPARPSRWEVVRGYLTLGIEHILTGPDHLLFVFGLLLLVSASRLLVKTITAFTLGHSLTLSAAALHFANVPSRPVEVLIALSVLTLAVELARDAERPTMLRRLPWAMAAGFPGGVPAVETPAGEFMWDSTAMIHHLELRFPEPAVLPPGPVQRFLCYVVEDAADEWLYRPAVGTRWYFPENAALGGF